MLGEFLLAGLASVPGLQSGTGRFGRASAVFTASVLHVRTTLEDGISYGDQQATLDGQLSGLR